MDIGVAMPLDTGHRQPLHFELRCEAGRSYAGVPPTTDEVTAPR